MSEQNSIFQQVTAKLPALFAPFNVIRGIAAPERWNDGEEFVTVKLRCKCGCERFHIKTAHRIDSGGLFGRKKEKTLISPVFVACELCQQDELLFDASVHGWDGQVAADDDGQNGSAVELFNQAAHNVVVNFSYQGLDNYADLIDDGVQNPEDYFDTLSIYCVDPGSGHCESVASFECA